jgi:A/G-specific adenine glycosylase
MKSLTKHLLAWYDENRILYPWRKTKQPYKIWLSEILLQQTRISVAKKFYEKILKRYPTLKDLARANDSDFLALWSGIGYYRRGQNMLSCAREIVKAHRGIFPFELSDLLKLPGIGKYTAGAIRNIAFGILTPALDGNIQRVLSRLTLSQQNLEEAFLFFANSASSSDFFQALMELGERVCLPDPECAICPVRKHCSARKSGLQKEFPPKKLRKITKVFHWYLLVLNSSGATYFVQNRNRAFLKNAWIFPDLLFIEEKQERTLVREFHQAWGIEIEGLAKHSVIRHAVTFRKIQAHILVPQNFRLNGSKGMWLNAIDLEKHPTSSITEKVLRSLQVKNRQTETAQETLKNS